MLQTVKCSATVKLQHETVDPRCVEGQFMGKGGGAEGEGVQECPNFLLPVPFNPGSHLTFYGSCFFVLFR